MLFHLLYPLHEEFALFNVFRYITFRTAGAVATAVALSLLFGPAFIRTLRRLSVGQNIRDVGPQSHQVKAGTPTMGGLLILFALVIPTLLWANLTVVWVWVAVGVTLAFGAIGFLDDYLKVRRGRNLGLTARGKFLAQVAVAAVAGALLPVLPADAPFSPTLAFPFFKDLVIHLGLLYVPFVVFVLVGVVERRQPDRRARRPGDRRDADRRRRPTPIFTYVAGNAVVADYLQIPYVAGAGELTVFCGALVGAAARLPLVQLAIRPRSSWATSARWRSAAASASSR